MGSTRTIVWRIACLVVVAASGSSPASAEKSAAAFVARTQVEVPAPPNEAWETLIAPERWWDKAHTWSGDAANLSLNAQAGGCFCERLPVAIGTSRQGRAGSVEHLHVVHVRPGKLLRMSGALGPLQGEAVAATLTITLESTNVGTRITWEYVVGGYMRFRPTEIGPGVAGVLAGQLGRLAVAIGPAVPGVQDRMPDGTPKFEVIMPPDSSTLADPKDGEVF